MAPNSRNKLILAAAAGVLLLVGCWAVRHDSPPLATATFMDVGQGDAILVAAGRVQALIDGGPGRQVLTGLGRAMPLTDRLIEYVIVTHPHADHVGGLAAVFGRYQVGRLILGGAGAATPEFAALRLAAVAQGVPVSVVRSGDSIRLSDDAALAVVHTAPASILRTSRDINEESLVLLLSVSCPDPGGAAGPASCGQLLLTGDAGAKTEAALLDAGDVPAADILKVGHHGSRQATTYGFLTGVQPRTAVISVGQNYYGHPSPALLKRLAARGIKVWRTDVHGDVVAVFGQAGVSWRSRRGVPP